MSETPFAITAEIAGLINSALDTGNTIVVAAVSPDAKPVVSFRGSVAVFGDQQLSFWLRNGTGGTAEAIRQNPNVSLLYRSPEKAPLLQFTGRARIVDQGPERDHAFEIMPEREQQGDAEKKGVAAIIDLDLIGGAIIRDGELQFLRLAR